MNSIVHSVAKRIHNSAELNWMELTHLLFCVMQACVTIAPNGLSASLDINLPVSKSQTPTQSLVTVTAKLLSSAKLFFFAQGEIVLFK